MTGEDKAKETFVQFVQENPYTGTAEQVVTLSLGIAAAGKQLSRATFALYRDASGIGDKVFSKLKVVGERLGELDDKTRRAVVKGLPASYSAIHLLCSLKPEELVTAVKTEQVTPKTSVRAATSYVRQVRFPFKSAPGGEVGRWGIKEETLFRVSRPEATALGEDQQQVLEEELRKVCSRFGVQLRQGVESTTSLREEDRRQKAAFWRSVLEGELPQKWFRQTDEEVRKQFNLKAVEEVWDAPLRSFTGFLVRTGGGQAKFYEEHGQAYVAKLHYLQETTQDRSTKYNLKRRIEEVLGDERGTRLAVWRNVVLKRSGFV